MASRDINDQHIEANHIPTSDELSEFDFKEYYSKEKTMQLRTIYIP